MPTDRVHHTKRTSRRGQYRATCFIFLIVQMKPAFLLIRFCFFSVIYYITLFITSSCGVPLTSSNGQLSCSNIVFLTKCLFGRKCGWSQPVRRSGWGTVQLCLLLSLSLVMDETTSACEDLKYFEHRLTEVIQSVQPAAIRWRLVLLVVFGCTLWSAYFWLMDPTIRSVTLVESLQKHLVFSACVPSLLILFGYVGIHNRVVAPSIIASRCRSVLADFSLSCDDSGKLIVRPHHRMHVSP